MEILIPVLIVVAVALIAGVGLGVANHFFAVKGDEKAEAIQKELPGANCGGCERPGNSEARKEARRPQTPHKCKGRDEE